MVTYDDLIGSTTFTLESVLSKEAADAGVPVVVTRELVGTDAVKQEGGSISFEILFEPRKAQKAAAKAAKAKAPKLTDHEKLMKRARKAYETEMRRRVKFMRQFSEKYMEYREFLRLDQEGNHTINPFTEEPEQDRMVSTVELEDGFVC